MANEIQRLADVDHEGNPAFVVSKKGVDVNGLLPTDFDKLNFHSSWNGVAQIVKAGSVQFTTRAGSPALRPSTAVRIDFPALPFKPVFTFDIRRRTSLNKTGVTYSDGRADTTLNVLGFGFGEQWRKVSTGGDDPYHKSYIGYSNTDHCIINASRRVSGALTNNNIWLAFNYIVWNLPANGFTPEVNTPNGKQTFLFGQEASGESVMKVSKAGVDVNTAEDKDLLIGGSTETPRLIASKYVSGPAKYVHVIPLPPLDHEPIIFVRTVTNGNHIMEPFSKRGSSTDGVWYGYKDGAAMVMSDVSARTMIVLVFTKGSA